MIRWERVVLVVVDVADVTAAADDDNDDKAGDCLEILPIDCKSQQHKLTTIEWISSQPFNGN